MSRAGQLRGGTRAVGSGVMIPVDAVDFGSIIEPGFFTRLVYQGV
jgi:hypothetical protein